MKTLEETDLSEELMQQLDGINQLLNIALPGGKASSETDVLGTQRLIEAKTRVLENLSRLKSEVINQDRLLALERSILKAWNRMLANSDSTEERDVVLKMQRHFKAALEEEFKQSIDI